MATQQTRGQPTAETAIPEGLARGPIDLLLSSRTKTQGQKARQEYACLCHNLRRAEQPAVTGVASFVVAKSSSFPERRNPRPPQDAGSSPPASPCCRHASRTPSAPNAFDKSRPASIDLHAAMDEKPNVGNGAEGVKPEGKPEKDQQINLKVKDADGNEVQFKVRFLAPSLSLCPSSKHGGCELVAAPNKRALDVRRLATSSDHRHVPCLLRSSARRFSRS
jgi:hypothetical protein